MPARHAYCDYRTYHAGEQAMCPKCNPCNELRSAEQSLTQDPARKKCARRDDSRHQLYSAQLHATCWETRR